MIAFDVLNLGVLGQPAGEGDSEVVAEGADLAALVGKVVDEFAVFAIFAGEDFAELEDGAESVSEGEALAKSWQEGHGRIYCYCAVTLEDGRNGGEYSISNDHVPALPCSGQQGLKKTEGRYLQSFVPLGVFNWN